jgi:Uma2 family endonuclease
LGGRIAADARAGIPVYWIINLIDRCVEIYTRPDPAAKEPTYLDKQIRSDSDSIMLTIAGKELGTISVKELLP